MTPQVSQTASPQTSDLDQLYQFTYDAEEHARLMAIVEGLFASVDEWQAAHGQVVAKAADLERSLAEALKAKRIQTQEALAERRRRLEAEAALDAQQTVLENARTEEQNALVHAMRRVEERAAERINRADEDRTRCSATRRGR